MTLPNWNGRKNKDEARIIATTKVNPKVAKVALFFPGENLLCIKNALKTGVINKRTFVISIQKTNTLQEKKIAKKIHKGYKTLGIKGEILEDEVYKCDLDNVLQGRKIDYAFFDFCGNVTGYLAYWLNIHVNAIEVLSEDAHIAFTICQTVRCCEFQNIIREITYNKVDKDIYRQFVNADGNYEHTLLYVHKVASKRLDTQEMKDVIAKNVEADAFSQLMTLFFALNKYKIKLLNAVRYNDSKTKMLFFNMKLKGFDLENIRKKYFNYIVQAVTQDFDNTQESKYLAVTGHDPSICQHNEPYDWLYEYEEEKESDKETKISGYVKTTPKGMTPAQWAWSPDNPKGIRSKQTV